MTAPGLWLAPCTHAEARHACESWHYSRRLPGVWGAGRIGVWEYGRFIGAVLFGPGACRNIGRPYGLDRPQVGELVRVALAEHQSPVTRIVAVAIRLVSRARPDLRLLVSFADPSQGHHGGIYQGGGWIYCGRSTGTHMLRWPDGTVMHKKSAMSKFGTNNAKQLGAEYIYPEQKHKYLMPLDDDMKNRIVAVAQPYPMRVKQATAGNPPASGGAAPTHTLHSAEAAE